MACSRDVGDTPNLGLATRVAQGAHSSTQLPSARSTALHRAAFRCRERLVERQAPPRPGDVPVRDCSVCHRPLPLGHPHCSGRRAFAPRARRSLRPRRYLPYASLWSTTRSLANALHRPDDLPPGSAAPTRQLRWSASSIRAGMFASRRIVAQPEEEPPSRCKFHSTEFGMRWTLLESASARSPISLLYAQFASPPPTVCRNGKVDRPPNGSGSSCQRQPITGGP